jgi:hypothetical protein
MVHVSDITVQGNIAHDGDIVVQAIRDTQIVHGTVTKPMALAAEGDIRCFEWHSKHVEGLRSRDQPLVSCEAARRACLLLEKCCRS